MVDWQGLFKWSLNYQDGTTSNKELKPMSDQDKKFLTEAFEAHALNVPNRMIDIRKELTNTQITEQQTIELLEQLTDLVQGLQNDSNLRTTGCLQIILRILQTSKNLETLSLAVEIFSSAVQNNSQLQKYVYDNNGIELFTRYLEQINTPSSQHSANRAEILFSALSTSIKSEYLPGKIQFLVKNGLSAIKNILLDENSSKRMVTKATALLMDLLYYDRQILMIMPHFPSLRQLVCEDMATINALLSQMTNGVELSKSKQRQFAARCFKQLVKYKYDSVYPIIESDLKEQIKHLQEQGDDGCIESELNLIRSLTMKEKVEEFKKEHDKLLEEKQKILGEKNSSENNNNNQEEKPKLLKFE